MVSCYLSRETDLQSLPLLLMRRLHLLHLRVQTLGRLPQPRALLLIICELKSAGREVTCSIRCNPASYLNLRSKTGANKQIREAADGLMMHV